MQKILDSKKPIHAPQPTPRGLGEVCLNGFVSDYFLRPRLSLFVSSRCLWGALVLGGAPLLAAFVGDFLLSDFCGVLAENLVFF